MPPVFAEVHAFSWRKISFAILSDIKSYARKSYIASIDSDEFDSFQVYACRFYAEEHMQDKS